MEKWNYEEKWNYVYLARVKMNPRKRTLQEALAQEAHFCLSAV